MKYLDRVLQRWRISQALPWILPGSRVLDIGACQGELFLQAGSAIAPSLGLEPLLPSDGALGPHPILAQGFPCDALAAADFDAITMLAVIEHLEPEVLAQLDGEFYRLLRPKGRIIITVPSPWVDVILMFLKSLRLIDGMELHQHRGFQPGQVSQLFSEERFRLLRRSRFQLGLNNLFVFEKR